MSGDPSRKPSNERVRVDVTWPSLSECRFCFGDGWIRAGSSSAGAKVSCPICRGDGRRTAASRPREDELDQFLRMRKALTGRRSTIA